MGQLNSIVLVGKIKSGPTPIPNSTEKMFVVRNRLDSLGAHGKGKRTYSRIAVVIPDLPTHAAVEGNLVTDAEVKVTGRLVRRKISRTDGTTYLTTCILGEYFEISIRSNPVLSDENSSEEEGEDADA